jgi:hypothetical protein
MNNFFIFLQNQFLELYKLISLVFIFADLILLILFLFFLKKALEFKPKFIFERPKKIITLRKEIFREQWFEIINFFESASLKDLKLVVFAADNLVNKILEEIGVGGKDLNERILKIDENSLESIKDLKAAHQFKINLEKQDILLDKKEIEEILKKYESFLKEIGIII